MSQIMTKVGPISSEILDRAVLELIQELQPVSFDELERNIRNIINIAWRTEVRFSVHRLMESCKINYNKDGLLEIL